MRKKVSNNQIQNNVIWNSIGYIGYLGLQWLITILIVRIAGYTAAGNLSLAMSATSMFHLTAGYGMRSFQISDTGKYSNRTYLNSRYITCLLSLLLCIIFTLIQSYTFEQRLYIILYMLFKLGEAFVDVYSGMVQKVWRLDIVGKSYLMRGVLTLLSFSLILYSSKSLAWAIIGMATSSYLVIFLYDRYWAFKLVSIEKKAELNKIGELLKECFPVVVFYFITAYVNYIPRYQLEKIGGTELLGIYSSIAAPALIVQSCAQVVFMPIIPLFSMRLEKKDIRGIVKLLCKCFAILFLIAIVAMVGAIAFGRWGLTILLGNQIEEYVYLLYPVIICTIMVSLMWLISNVLIAFRELKGVIISGFVGLVFCIIMSPIFIHNFGANGVSLAQIFSQISMSIIMMIFLAKKLHVLNRKSIG